MATKKTTKKEVVKKSTAGKKRKRLFEDPPILVGGGGSTLISLPKGTPGTTVGDYDVYTVSWDVKTILKKNSKNGTKRKSKPTDNGYEVQFWRSDF